MSNSDKPLERPRKPVKPNKPSELVESEAVKLAAAQPEPKPKLELVRINQPTQPKPPELNIESETESKIEQVPSETAQNLETIAPDPTNNQTADQIEVSRIQPIAPVTDLMQYRAIGVVYGTYIPQDEVLTKGILVTSDGTEIETVLLGRVIAVVKKRLDLAKEYCWVVYPRTRTKTGLLHLQITGVWAPEELGKADQTDDPGVNDGYFSIRGEVVSQSFEQNVVIIKILRKDPNKTLDRNHEKFKLQLTGTLPNHPVGYFWEINAKRSQNTLEIVDGSLIAPIFNRSKLQKTSKEVIFKPKRSSDAKSSPIPKSQRLDSQILDSQKPESIKRERPTLKKPQAPASHD